MKMTRRKIELETVTPHNIKLLRHINNVIFPISYKEGFYKEVLEAGELAKLVYFNDVVVGAICCSVINKSNNNRQLYISTLGCLYPYRRLGIGTRMIHYILDFVENDGNFDSVYLHVQVNNKIAIIFYEKFGFEIVGTIMHYYPRLEPSDAYILQKTTRHRKDVDESLANKKTSRRILR